MQRVPWLSITHSFGAVDGDPTLLGMPEGCCPLSTRKGDNKARNIGKAPRDPPPNPPNCCPHAHHPLPAPPHARNTFLRYSSCFPPPYQERFFQHGRSPHFPKMHPEGLKQQEKPRGSQGVCKSLVPPALPLAPWHAGGQGPLTLILCRRHLGLPALSRRLAAIRSQVLLGFHKNRSLAGGGGELFLPAISAGHAGERGGEGK